MRFPEVKGCEEDKTGENLEDCNHAFLVLLIFFTFKEIFPIEQEKNNNE